MIRVEEVKSYKWVKLKENPPKNAVLYVLDPITREVELFVTNKNGLPKPIKSYIDIKDYVKVGSDNAIIVDNNRLFVKKYKAGDDYINIVESPNNYTLTLNIDSIVADVVEIVEATVGDKNFEYDQGTPSQVWTINHSLNKKPSVTVLDTAGTDIEGQITIPDNNTVIIEFNFPFSGKAILN